MSNPTDTNQASEDELKAIALWSQDRESKEAALEALIRTEKLKLLAEVRERVVGEDEGLVEVTKHNLVTASHFNAVIKSRNQLRETIRKKLMEAEL